MAGYKELPHTADVRLLAWGDRIVSLFEQCARGMQHIIQPEFATGGLIEKHINITGLDDESILVEFLSTILFWIEVDKVACFDYHLAYMDGRFYGWIKCKPYLTIARNIKAVTYHDLTILRNAGEYSTEIVFDV